jgi:hypothetical protein
MRIPSYQKIEKQARKYSDDSFDDMPKEWYNAYSKLEKRHSKIRNKWNKIRDNCPGNDYGNTCICKTFPEYEELVIKQLEPLTKQLNDMYGEKVDKKKLLYLKELRLLQRIREAKENYSKTLF